MRFNLGLLVGNGLLTSLNDFHRRQRRLVAPAFQHRRIGAYADVMADYAERTQAEWRDGQAIDVAQEMMRLTLWVVGKTLFDADVRGEAGELGQALSTALRFANDRFTAVAAPPLSWPTPRNRQARLALARLDATIYRLIAEWRATGEDRGDLLSMLLQAQDEDDGSFMTDAQVRDEAMTLFLAGHETTANALAWSWYLLAQHPEASASRFWRAPTLADLKHLPYTEMVVKESMRLYPPAPMISRQAARPIDLGGYRLPSGALVLISPYTMHRLPNYFPDPQRFDPDRWTPEFERALPRHAYMPFGGGPRICIGNQFALMEGQIILAALAQRVRFELSPGPQIAPEAVITLRPKGGVRMIVNDER